MEQYRGWQIIKMISEGILKNGDQIKTGSGDIATLVEGNLVVGPTETMIPTGCMTKDSIVFEIMEQPVTFDEVVKSDKLCRVEHELIKDNPYFGKHKYRKLNEVMAILSAWFGDENLKTIIRKGKWYLE